MHTIIHRLVVLTILVAGFLIARFYPAAESSKTTAKTETDVLAPFQPVIEKEGTTSVDTFPIRTPATPVASPEALGMFHELTVATQSKSDGQRQFPVAEEPKRDEEINAKPKPRHVPRMLPPISRDAKSPTRPRRESDQVATRQLPSIQQEERRKRRRGRLTTHRIADGDDLPL
ncbi:hypothetical protein ACFL2H_07780, partial [Planctomycetota bacterium]